jgi:hypothetical protein
MDAEEKRKREQAANDIRTVMATVEGRRLLWHLIDSTAGVFSASYGGDALSTAYNEGRRGVGIELMQAIQQVASADYMRALHEALTSRQFAAAEAERRRERDE